MNSLPFLKAPKGLAAFTSLRRASDLGMNTDSPAARVLASRRALWKERGLRLEDSVFMKQVHGDRLVEVGPGERGRGAASLEDAIQDCDLLLSRGAGTLLCVGHADCLAVLLADPKSKSVGVAHMGWRGAALKVAGKLAKAMDCDPKGLWAGLSVCLGPCHLELSEAQYPSFQGRASAGALKDGHFMLDLQACAIEDLEEAGILPSQIEAQKFCTAEDLSRFYSYRAEGGHCGRMLSCAGFVL
jgi:YfiH family protein